MKEPDLILNMIDTNTKENNQKIIKNEKLKQQQQQQQVQNANTNGINNTGITNNNNNNHDDHHKAEIITPRTVPVNKNENSPSTTSTCDEENRKMLEKIRSNNKVNVLKCNNQIKELHTLLRDKYLPFLPFIITFFFQLLTLYFLFYFLAERHLTVTLNSTLIDWLVNDLSYYYLI